MSRQFITDLSDGTTVEEVYHLAEKQVRANRNANLYLLATLRDRTGHIHGLMWNVTEEMMSEVEAGSFVKVRGKVQLFQGNLQVIVTHIHHVEPVSIDLADFEETPKADVETLMSRLREILLSIDDPPLRSLMECFLIDEPLMATLARAVAGVKAHHAYHGGLVEHIVTMMEVARRIEDLYPAIDFNLLLAGIFLHDLGKVREMDFETSMSYTDEGQLLGHMAIGIEMLNEKIVETAELMGEPFPQEMSLRLKHMIVSHHGTYEFGSARLPMTPEAIALHHIDNLDAKVHEFAREIDGDPNSGSHWTPYLSRINRKLFKGEQKKDAVST